jgi:type IV secretion system protein VirB10
MSAFAAPIAPDHSRDPRLDLAADDLEHASRIAAPQVGRPPGRLDLGLAACGAGALALGALTVWALGGHPPSKAQAPPPAAAPHAVAAARSAPRATAVKGPVVLASTAADPGQSRSNPLIVDNSESPALATAKPAGPPAAAGPGQGQPSQILSAEEQFSLRVGGDQGPAQAQALHDPAATVTQGTMIPAVLETALNSDLPGYARAIVSRDVRGFDGAKVVIPRGSRLIGQYKSSLSTGQSRAFIVWTRLIRPDGVSIALGSPVMDEAGETGLGGKVDRHFLQRFGGAMLLSVVSALPGALAGGSSTALVINSGSGGAGAASQALEADAKIPPTIRVPLGTPIQVFAARDLEFGGV